MSLEIHLVHATIKRVMHENASSVTPGSRKNKSRITTERINASHSKNERLDEGGQMILLVS